MPATPSRREALPPSRKYPTALRARLSLPISSVAGEDRQVVMTTPATSPTPAARPLRGPVPAWKEGDLGDLAVDHGVEHGEGLPHGDAATLAPSFLGHEGEYRSRAEVDKPPRLIVVILKRSDVVPDRLAEFFVAI